MSLLKTEVMDRMMSFVYQDYWYPGQCVVVEERHHHRLMAEFWTLNVVARSASS